MESASLPPRGRRCARCGSARYGPGGSAWALGQHLGADGQSCSSRARAQTQTRSESEFTTADVADADALVGVVARVDVFGDV